jgi:hypothetical protein
MTVVDLDFEEELKETNFPDLLDGVATVDDTQQPRKKVSSRRKVVKGTNKTVEKRKTDNLDRTSKRNGAIAPQNSPTQMVPVVASVNSKKLSRIAVDPPISPESGSSGIDHRDHSKRKSSLLSDNIGKLLTPPLDITAGQKVVNKETEAIKLRRNDKVDKKPTHKSIKRDFIEQVSYDTGLSKSKIALPASSSRKPSPVPTSTNENIASSPTDILSKAAELSPKPHGINELDSNVKIPLFRQFTPKDLTMTMLVKITTKN